tara:strand:+ start:120 stop:698 length:579 start_codon:yes stop_codon:yes gene_type:complete
MKPTNNNSKATNPLDSNESLDSFDSITLESIQPLNVPTLPPELPDCKKLCFDYFAAKNNPNYKPIGYQPLDDEWNPIWSEWGRHFPLYYEEYKKYLNTPPNKFRVEYRHSGITKDMINKISMRRNWFYENEFDRVYCDQSTNDDTDSVLVWSSYFETFYWRRPIDESRFINWLNSDYEESWLRENVFGYTPT